MQNLKYKFRLDPTTEQEQKLFQIAGSTRYVWNYFLNKEQEYYSLTGQFAFFNRNSADLTTLKQAPYTDWLQTVPATSLQQTLRNLDTALTQSFKGQSNRKGFPKFKKKKNFSASFTLSMVTSERNILENGTIFHIAKDLDVKIVMHRSPISDFKTCQIVNEGDCWYVVLTCKTEKLSLPKTGRTTGIDLNSKEFVLSDGQRFAIPKYLKEKQPQIEKLQQTLSRKVKGSNNRKKAHLKLFKVHQSIRNSRLDYFHKLSKRLVTEYDVIALEDLNVASIQEKYGNITKDNGFGMFRSMIEYKSELYDKEAIVIDRWFPSSQLCSGCGVLHKMDLSIRTYKCSACGMEMDRDLNAAINIQRAGIAPAPRIKGGEGKLPIVNLEDKALVEMELDLDQLKLISILSNIHEEGSYVL